LRVIFALLDPDPDSGFNPDTDPDPDPQPFVKEQLKTGGLPIILRPLDSSAAPISLIIKQTPRS
jgi:hypothetical protein